MFFGKNLVVSRIVVIIPAMNCGLILYLSASESGLEFCQSTILYSIGV